MLQLIVLGLGSNIGNREKYLKTALKLLSLKKNFLYIASSGIYETEPWGFKYQNNFLNCVSVFLYRSGPYELQHEIIGIEQKVGRIKREKWHAREIDIDILFFGDKIIHKKNLLIPHPMISQRYFVLVPLSEILPEFIHPGTKRKISSLLKNSKDTGTVKLYKKNI